MSSGLMAGRRDLTEGLNIQQNNDFILPLKRGTSKKLELCSGRSYTGKLFKSEKIKFDDHQKFAEEIYMPEMPDYLLHAGDEEEEEN